MSAEMRGKYEILKMLRGNILYGLESFGLPVITKENSKGWNCMEANQQGLANMDQIILLDQKKTSRLGWQYHRYRFRDNSAKKDFGRTEYWMEQQEWEIKALLKRRTAPVTADTVTTNDVITMLVTWFNGGPGLDIFRENRCGNLLIQQKDIRLYKDSSNVNQYTSSFVLKLHVPKNFEFVIPGALVKFEGFIGV